MSFTSPQVVIKPSGIVKKFTIGKKELLLCFRVTPQCKLNLTPAVESMGFTTQVPQGRVQ